MHQYGGKNLVAQNNHLNVIDMKFSLGHHVQIILNKTNILKHFLLK